MNENSIKWISCSALDMTPLNLSLLEKVNKFGYALVLDEFGSDISTKAQLCIHDVLMNKEKPNILIITSPKLMHAWYKSLLLGLGVDFKFVAGSKNAIMYFSKDISNLYIMSDDSLDKESGNKVVGEMRNSDMVWDLIIIDTSLFIDGVNVSLYTENLKTKAEKLIVFSPVPAFYSENCDEIKKLVSSLLSNVERALTVENVKINEDIVGFSLDTPVMKYYSENAYGESYKRHVTVVEYEFDKNLLSPSKRLDDVQTGIPHYIHGGNLFEEYGLDERKLYQKQNYSAQELDKLRSVDKKLDAFLTKIDAMLQTKGNTAIVYFVTEASIDYVKKALYSLYPHKKDMICILKSEVYDTDLILNNYEGVSKTEEPRIVLATDLLGEKCLNVKKLTHIYNYELPDAPVYLEYRYARRGVQKTDSPEFIVFMDKNKQFDSRVLGKSIGSNIYKSFRKKVPSKSVWFSIPGIHSVLADMLIDLKYISGYTGEVGSSFDVISRFRSEYNIPAEIELPTAAKAHDYASKKLEILGKAFDVTALLSEKNVDADKLRAVLADKIDQFKRGFVYFDDDMTLRVISGEMLFNDEYKFFCTTITDNPCMKGLKNAVDHLDTLAGGGRGYPYIKNDTSQLTDALLPSVLYNIWRYWKTERGISRSFVEFIKMYNEGVI